MVRSFDTVKLGSLVAAFQCFVKPAALPKRDKLVVASVKNENRRGKAVLADIVFDDRLLCKTEVLKHIDAAEHLPLGAARHTMILYRRLVVHRRYIRRTVVIYDALYGVIEAFQFVVLQIGNSAGKTCHQRGITSRGVSHEEHLFWVDIILPGMLLHELYARLRVEDKAGERLKLRASVFEQRHRIAPRGKKPQLGNSTLDVLLPECRTRYEDDKRRPVRRRNWLYYLQIKRAAVSDNVGNVVFIRDLIIVAGRVYRLHSICGGKAFGKIFS